MKRFAILLILAASIVSCSDHQSDKEFLTALNSNLEQVNNSLENQNEVILRSLKDRLNYPESAVKAGIWMPKAKEVDDICTEFEKQLSGLKQKKVSDKEISLLVENFKYRLCAVDSLIRYEFGNVINGFPFSTAKDSSFFAMITPARLSTRLNECYFTNLIQQTRLLKNKILEFIHEKGSTHVISEDFFSYSFIIGQNSSVFEPSEIVEISAGMGEFTSKYKPTIKIRGKNVKVNESGIANHRFTAPSKPGTYQIPVDVSFKNDDSIMQTQRKIVEIKVKQCKQ